MANNKALNDLVAEFVTGVFQAKLDATSKSCVVEKTPIHRLCGSIIGQLLPLSCIVNCVRRGRDKCLSMLEKKT